MSLMADRRRGGGDRRSAIRDMRSSDIELQPQLAQLLWIDFARRLGHQADRTWCLRECDDVAQRRATTQQHRDAVEAESDTAMRRRAARQGIEQEPKLRACFGFADAEQCKHPRLNVRPVN